MMNPQPKLCKTLKMPTAHAVAWGAPVRPAAAAVAVATVLGDDGDVLPLGVDRGDT